MPSVRNVDVASVQMTPAPSVERPFSAIPTAPRRQQAWWVGGLLVIALVVGIGLWSQSGTTQSSLLGELGVSVRAFFSSDVGERIERLVAKGDRALSAGQPFDPIKGSAIDFYQQAIKLAPAHEGALQGIALILGRLLTATEEALAAGDIVRAEVYLQTLGKLPDPSPTIAELELELAAAKAASAANAVQHDRIQEFLNEAATDIAEGRILEPSGDNALVRYRAIQVLDPGNAAANRGLAAIVARLSAEHARALASRDFALAGKLLQ